MRYSDPFGYAEAARLYDEAQEAEHAAACAEAEYEAWLEQERYEAEAMAQQDQEEP